MAQKDMQLNLRITQDENAMLDEAAGVLHYAKSGVVRKGIEMVYAHAMRVKKYEEGGITREERIEEAEKERLELVLKEAYNEDYDESYSLFYSEWIVDPEVEPEEAARNAREQAHESAKSAAEDACKEFRQKLNRDGFIPWQIRESMGVGDND